MSIISFWFFLFVLAAVFVYYVTPKKFRWCVLLTASTAFFTLTVDYTLFLIFAAQVFFAWLGARLIEKKETASTKKAIAVSVIILQICTLVVFKESLFFTANARTIFNLLGIDFHIADLEWIAPLGISYYTLILISYVLDVWWGNAKAQSNYLRLLLFAGFFPQMISGPFTRYSSIGAQLFDGNKFDYQQFCFGVQRFMWGLFKKLVLAERLAVIVGTIYGNGSGTNEFSGVYILIGAFTYVLQIYTDFSGCMDMVIGVALIFGIKLPENFNTPFYSTSLSEFWQRWHMTLGLWLKDYVLYPVLKSSWMSKIRGFCKNKYGKKAANNISTYIGMLITWFCVGFWHGGSWQYIFGSGLFFFVMIAGGLILKPYFVKLADILRINRTTWSWTMFQRLRTIFLFALSVSFGRAASLTSGFRFWKRAVVFNPSALLGSLSTLGLDEPDFLVMRFGLALLFIVSYLQQKGSVREIISRQNLVFRWLLWLGLFAIILIFGKYGEGYVAADFIYGGF